MMMMIIINTLFSTFQKTSDKVLYKDIKQDNLPIKLVTTAQFIQ